jgi:primosomal replication protein N
MPTFYSYPPNLLPTSGDLTILPRFPTTEEVVLVNNQIVLATGYVETNVSQSLDDGLDHVVATVNVDARTTNSIVTVQAQTALAISATGAATPVAKYFIINGVATPVVGYFCPDTTATGGANWSISGMAQSLEIAANTPIVVQWVLGGADAGCEVTTGFTNVSVTVTPGPTI